MHSSVFPELYTDGLNVKTKSPVSVLIELLTKFCPQITLPDPLGVHIDLLVDVTF